GSILFSAGVYLCCRSGMGRRIVCSRKPACECYTGDVACDIKSLTREELEDQFQKWAEPPYRVDQLLRWLYLHRVTRWEAMTNLPKSLREELARRCSFTSLDLVLKQGSRDTTQKFLWRLDDHSL